MTKKSDIKVVHVPVDDLKPAAYNPRRHSREAAEKLRDSISRFGLIDPIIANSAPKRRNIVIGGHFRITIAREMGYETVPVVYVRIPDVKKEKELNLRLNRNIGEWDFELLKNMDLDLLLDVGFDNVDLASIWDEALSADDDNFDVEKELAKIKKPSCKLGELYALGEHRLIIGDSTDKATIEHLMKKDRADMVYSDPPFNIGFDYAGGISGKGKYGGTTKDARTATEYRTFIATAMKNSLAVSKKDTHVFWWCDQRYIGMFQSLYEDLNITNRRVTLWVKNGFNVTPNVAFNKSYEPCVYGTVGTPYLNERATNFTEILNKEVSTGNRALDDIIDIFDIWLARRLPGQDYTHPTEKPTTLHEKPLRRCTRPGDIVLDLFGGSGSTLIACEQMKRKARLVEIDPVFAQVILNRYENFTGKKAKLLR